MASRQALCGDVNCAKGTAKLRKHPVNVKDGPERGMLVALPHRVLRQLDPAPWLSCSGHDSGLCPIQSRKSATPAGERDLNIVYSETIKRMNASKRWKNGLNHCQTWLTVSGYPTGFSLPFTIQTRWQKLLHGPIWVTIGAKWPVRQHQSGIAVFWIVCMEIQASA